MLRHFKNFDWILIGSAILLVLIGLIALWSISAGQDDYTNLKKQIIFFIIAIILMVGISFLDWRSFRENPYLILAVYFICIILLLGLFFIAPEIRGVKSWYKIGSPSGGLSFGPVGITTLVLIVLLAKFFSTRHVEMYKLKHILLSGIYVLIPFLLIARQPDLGSALILLVLWIGVLIVSGIKLRHFLLLGLVGLVVFSLSWSLFLKDYQKQRILSFLAPEVEILGINWSQTQSKIAIGSGGLVGKGFGEGSQTQLGFLSEPHTDFIFSVIAEEWGLLGILVMLALFSVLIWRIMRLALLAEYNFPRLFAFGLAIVIFFQFFAHIGMNLGILPVIGLPLPFVSYGGSSLIALFMGIGLLQGIRTH